MISLILSIVTAVVVIAGVAYIIYSYAPVISDFVNSLYGQFEAVTSVVPSWLYPFIAIVLLFFIIGIIIKLL